MQLHAIERGARLPVLGIGFDTLGWDIALARIAEWAARRESRYVCFGNVHSVVTARSSADLRSALQGSDMVAPDGMAVVRVLRVLGQREQERICGPDLTAALCARAEAEGLRVALYGSKPSTVERLRQRLNERHPRLRIVASIAPPFRALTRQEDEAVCARLNESGAHLVLVGLGCPKQELWMADHRGRVQAVMLGVGAAFDFLAGTVPRAPLWMQRSGLEWVHRVGCEPNRLGRRFLVTNTLFLLSIVWALWRRKGVR